MSTTEPPVQNVVGPEVATLAAGKGAIVMVLLAVTVAQGPAAAIVLVTVYVPAADVVGSTAPVWAVRVKPVEDVKGPAVAPLARTGAALLEVPAHKTPAG